MGPSSSLQNGWCCFGDLQTIHKTHGIFSANLYPWFRLPPFEKNSGSWLLLDDDSDDTFTPTYKKPWWERTSRFFFPLFFIGVSTRRKLQVSIVTWGPVFWKIWGPIKWKVNRSTPQKEVSWVLGIFMEAHWSTSDIYTPNMLLLKM